MAGERTFLQVPPDSTGKRVRMTHTAEVFFTGATPSNYAWDVGEMYFVEYTNGETYMMHVHGYHYTSSTSGILEVHYNKTPKYNNESPAIGATIYDEDGVTPRATVESVRDVYINSNHIIGYDNPEYGLDVDRSGSANIRFSEGRPQLDAFGKLRVSGASVLGDYTFANNFLPSEFTRSQFGTGRVGFNDVLHCAELTTGTSLATANFGPDSHRIQITSNTYHHYFPGLSQLAIMTVALSEDVGYTGVMREWGYFDGEYDFDITDQTSTNELIGGNGYFFRVTGESGLQIVIRTDGKEDSPGTKLVRETVFDKNGYSIRENNIVVESSPAEGGFNGDPVDGTGDSGKALDLSEQNVYWIDIQDEQVRFGTYHEGQRVVIHSYLHTGPIPMTATNSLPLRFCQHNMKNISVAQSGKFLRVWHAAVFTEASIETATLGTGRTEYFKAIIDPTNMNDVQGLNDAFGDRVITTKTGITSSGATLTVPNLTGIKPGWIVKVASGTGVVQSETRVKEITSATTVVVDKTPTTAIINTDSVTFEMPVNDEYYLIGILAPKPQLTGVNHPNRTLYLPRSARAWAYYEDGSPAHLSFQVYVNPTISGVNRAVNIEAEEAATLGVEPVLTPVEPNEPSNAVVAYGKNGIDKVNLFRDSGIHGLVTYNGVGFDGGQEDLSGAFTSLQSAFKNEADNGGNNTCPLARIFQSRSAGEATVIQINTPPTGVGYSLHREGNAIQLIGIPGTIGSWLNKDGVNVTNSIYYLRMIDNDKAELYYDKAFSQPVDTSQATTGVDPATNAGGTIDIGSSNTDTVAGGLTWRGNTGDFRTGGFIASGYGPEFYFCIFAKPQGPSKGDSPYYSAYQAAGLGGVRGKIEVNFALFWNQINQ